MSNDETTGPAETWHGIPEDSIILGEIRIVNYLNSQGQPRFGYAVHDLSGGDGMTNVETLGLIELAKMVMVDRWKRGESA